MATARIGHTATLLPNGKVLIAGGQTPGCCVKPLIFSSAELYDPSTGSFSATGEMTTPRSGHTATLLPNGKVLIAGGPTAELYDPVTGTFSATGNMATGGIGLAILLNDGKVLITGGNQYYPFGAGGRDAEHPQVSLAELYNPPVLTPPPVLLSLSDQGAILHASTHELVSPDNPGVAGEALEIYFTGLTDGSAIPPQVAIGGRMAEVLWFGNTPGYAGLNQVNIRVPSGIAPGPAISVRLNDLGRPSNEVMISVR